MDQLCAKHLRRLKVKDGIDLYFGSVLLAQEERELLENVLSSDERERAQRFVHLKDQYRYIACRGFLRVILSQVVSLSPEKLVFQLGEHGKPRLIGKERAEIPEFNVSHSYQHVCIAIHPCRPVGVDIEYKRRDWDFGGVASYLFTNHELDRFQKIRGDLRVDAFYQAWARKEAFVKATGEGLHRSLHSFEVLLQDTYRDARHFTSEKIDIPPWSILSLDLHPDYAAAVCYKSSMKHDQSDSAR